MRVTIIPEDGVVSIDGEAFSELDLSFLGNNIHAIQWYGTEGEVEYTNDKGRASHNVFINDFTPYQHAINLWQQAKTLSTQNLDGYNEVP